MKINTYYYFARTFYAVQIIMIKLFLLPIHFIIIVNKSIIEKDLQKNSGFKEDNMMYNIKYVWMKLREASDVLCDKKI